MCTVRVVRVVSTRLGTDQYTFSSRYGTVAYVRARYFVTSFLFGFNGDYNTIISHIISPYLAPPPSGGIRCSSRLPILEAFIPPSGSADLMAWEFDLWPGHISNELQLRIDLMQ